MNWQETVIDMSSVANKSLQVAMVSILRQQAEASYKAGHMKATLENNTICHLDIYKGGVRYGMRKVVEFVDTLELASDGDFFRWQAFLKENGLDKEVQ